MRRVAITVFGLGSVGLGSIGCGAAEPVSETTPPRGESRQDVLLLPQGLLAEGRTLLAAVREGRGDLDAFHAFAERLATELPLALGEHTTEAYRLIVQLTGEPAGDAASLAEIDAILTHLDRPSIEVPPFVRRTTACADYEDDSDCIELWPGYWVEHDDWYCRSDLECPDRFDCVATPGAGAHCGPPEHPRSELK